MSGCSRYFLAVFREMLSRLAASRTDTLSRSTRRRNLLRVPTLITPAYPCQKIQQGMWITWLRFGVKFR